MKPTKEGLINENVELVEKLQESRSTNVQARKTISSFLGSFESSPNFFGQQKETKVLTWAEIYFELGKIIERNKEAPSLKIMSFTVEGLVEKVNRLMEDKTKEEPK